MSSSTLKPRLIIHGGAGNYTRENLYPHAWEVYSSTLLTIHRSTSALLSHGATALDAATHAVTLFEDSPLFNCGKGAVFTRDGTIELEASVMVTRDFRKRGCAVVLVNKVKNPIKVAREMLVRGEKDDSGSGGLSGGGGGAQGHCCLGGETVEKLAKSWGLEMVDESYFWTRRRWDEHKRGLHESRDERALRQMDVWPYSVDSHTLLIGLAILQAPSSRATVSEIGDWLSKKAAWRVGPQHIWQTRVPSELKRESESHHVLHQYLGKARYFTEQQPQENEIRGSEPYWTIAPEKVAHFVKARDEGYALHNKYEEHQEDKCRWPLFPEQDSGWDGQAYLPQGTVGCVALDQYGTMCVATSTGGVTNKLSGRIGDTPTIGAGFWAEEWSQSSLERRTRPPQDLSSRIPAVLNGLSDGLRNVMGDCIPNFSGYQEVPSFQEMGLEKAESMSSIRAVAMSGTGNGDSFLRLAAARTAGAIVRFSPNRSLASAINQVAGSGGELERSAGDRWGETGEGEGGIIGIELVGGKGKIAFDFNCGGMFRCWVDDHGKEKVMVFKDEY
ncbi:hypothetical protein HO173_001651 [Letharia columbiana]|uniref:Fork-head domain-containing protein n=1 Tax=Letharia columbiana TaxID=112416 RepID=A0A8H6L925_9LECA|nr:uncharacterized protein HO173_001651 [Letharia columbiana]KAF6240041.1 hypothetical protein HO173_001651 [Letharia columbiana]